MRRLLPWLGSLVQVFASFGAAYGQGTGEESSKPSAIPYMAAAMATMLVLVILCAPSRKR